MRGAVLSTPAPRDTDRLRLPMLPKRTCSIADCLHPHHARGYCSTHYGNLLRIRTPIAPRTYIFHRPSTSAEVRAWRKVVIRDGCWDWAGSGTRYGLIPVKRENGKMCGMAMAHRVIYESLLGPIADGLVLDHLCTNTYCVRPDHLEPVTNVVNILRGTGFAAVNARKTHCKYGHELTPENLVPSHPGRACLTCARGRKKRKIRIERTG